MEDVKLYKENLEKRFHYHVGFWSSIIAFFTQSSPYNEAIDEIQKKDIHEAFKSDAQQLHRDFQNACTKNYNLFGVSSPGKHLVDACK
ncbi:hypothetical protein [Niastella sp. OAS944]|uniref:hypothetical protein n=1 Tax=Niastella sp. OAS944 TaxID=2664089 RepID=UPI003485FB45|nr:hypothetical protein [Chitinophagaceae bacterium OAS944]